jgi:SAM-dependent MidA family methyltransferase
MGTLLCHYRHRAHADPFLYPGLQDITANVDFTALADAVLDSGLELLGYTAQNNFLFGCGLERYLSTLDPTGDYPRYLALTAAVKQLTLPGAMGERFKALACGRGVALPLWGFSLRDERFRL